jgi:hypothetical protein
MLELKRLQSRLTAKTARNPMHQAKRLQSIAAFRINGVSLRGLYPRYTLLSVLLCHLPPTESSADDLLWPDASVRRNTTAKQMTPFGVFREGCGRSTVMHLPSGKAGLTHGSSAQWQESESWIGQERRYGAKLVY